MNYDKLASDAERVLELERQLHTAEQERDKLQAENERLRQWLHATCREIGDLALRTEGGQ